MRGPARSFHAPRYGPPGPSFAPPRPASPKSYPFFRTLLTADLADFVSPVTQTLTFNEGITTRNCTFTVFNETVDEDNETFVVRIQNAVAGTISPTADHLGVLIFDNDGPGHFQFAQTGLSVIEGSGGTVNAALVINRTGGSVGSVTVRCTGGDPGAAVGGATFGAGFDYDNDPVDVVFANGVTTGSCLIPINPETESEPSETETFSLSFAVAPPAGALIAVPTSTVLTILDDDGSGTIALSAATYSVAEGGGSRVVTINRTGGTGGISVNYATADGTASAGADYTATVGTALIAEGATSTTFSVPILGDGAAEGPETFTVTLSGVSAGATLVAPASATVTIDDDDGPPPGPSITSVSPTFGPLAGGTVVIITGSGFSGTTGAAGVKFGDTNATTYTVDNSTQITATSPAHAAGTVQVMVTAPSGTTADTAGDDFTYTSGPTITMISPTSGPTGGTVLVVITGTGFTGATSVTFGGTESLTWGVDSNTQITALAPKTVPPGIVDVRVTGPNGVSPVTPGDKYTYTGSPLAPTVTLLAPNSISLNTTMTVTITGTNFTAASTVKVGDLSATNVVVVSSTKITFTAPAKAASGVFEVVVTTVGGSSATAGTQNDLGYGVGVGGPTVTLNLFPKWSLLTWISKTTTNIANTVKGIETPPNPATNDVSGRVTAIYRWSPQGVGCPVPGVACWLAWFPDAEGVPGAINLFQLLNGDPVWVGINGSTALEWRVAEGP